MTDLRRVPVEQLIPHSPPMVLIDKVIDYDANSLVAEVAIHEGVMFYDAAIQGVPAWAGIEYMAQSISALAGTRAMEIGQPIKLGFLLGTRKLELYRKVFVKGLSIQVEVRQLLKDDSGLASFECRILHNQEVYVQARVNVFETDDISTIV